MAIALALLLRLALTGWPTRFAAWVTEPERAAFLVYWETGHDLRFSGQRWGHAAESAGLAREALPAFDGNTEISLYRQADVSPDIASLLEAPLSWDLTVTGPSVLIFHTHGTESYAGICDEGWRSADSDKNLLALGAALQTQLAAGGITALHDQTLHDYPAYDGAYVRARETLAAYLETYPSLQLVLDIHRDASSGAAQMRTRATVNGQSSAQLMLVLGTGHADYEENLALAVKLHAWLETTYPGIMRPLQLRTQRFNQDLHPQALIVEVGAAGNTLEEAQAAVSALGEAIVALSQGAN